MHSRDLVLSALHDLYGRKDPSAVDRWLAPHYRQHSGHLADGREAVRREVAALPPTLAFRPVHVIADRDLVVVYGCYLDPPRRPLRAVEMVRVHDGLLHEHWDALSHDHAVDVWPSGTEPDSGLPPAVGGTGETAANENLIRAFVRDVLHDRHYHEAHRYLAPRTCPRPAHAGSEHSVPDARAYFSRSGRLSYHHTHHVVAEGDLVAVHSEVRTTRPAVCFDFFRLRHGRITGHLRLAQPIPATPPHDNGPF